MAPLAAQSAARIAAQIAARIALAVTVVAGPAWGQEAPGPGAVSPGAPDPAILKPAIERDGALGFAALQSRGYTPLFNGHDLTGWRNPYPHGEAKVVDGEIHLLADNKFFLVTDKKYADFRLSVDIHLPEGKANSGIMFRCHVDDDAPRRKVFGYQAECDGSDRRWSGGLFDEARRGWIWPSVSGRSEDRFLEHEAASQAFFADPTVANALNRNGWNRYVITCIGDQIAIEVNGVRTTTFRDPVDAAGYIGIQHHGEKGQTYRFRNIFIKELPERPAEGVVSLQRQAPVSVKKINDKVTLVDFGKAAYGNLEMRVPQSGRGMVRVHFGEKLKDGRVDRNPPGSVRYGMSEMRKSSGARGTWVIQAPIFPRNVSQVSTTFMNPPAVLVPQTWGSVIPFRWVEIEGWEGEFKPEYITRRAAFPIHWNDEASGFTSSNETLNRIWDLCQYSIKATCFAGVYVDGDRERIPYEADAYLNQLSHYYTDDDVQMAAKTFDWLMENGTWPTEWAPHMVFMAHAEWMYSGDVEWLAHRYESLKAKTLMHRSAEDGLVRSSPIDQRRHDIVDWPREERDGYVFTPINTVVNAFHIKALQQMAELARAIGKDGDADAFEARADLALNAFQRTLFDGEAGVYRDGIDTDHSSIHANFFPLAFGLVPDDKVPGVVAWLKKADMRCSVYAAQYFMQALFENGGDRRAMALILADGDRSWKHMVNSGTTISWEAWDLKYKPNQDWNHAWGAAPANLLPRFVLGAESAASGWARATIRPFTSGLTFAKGRVPTAMGPIDIDWKADPVFSMSLTLPDGMPARVDLPAAEGSTGVWVNGQQAEAEKSGDRWVLSQDIYGSVTLEVK